MIEHIVDYYKVERTESLIFIAVGLLSVISATYVWLFIEEHLSFYKGLAIVLAFIGLLQVSVCFPLYLKNNNNTAKAVASYQQNQTEFRSAELLHIKQVRNTFSQFKYFWSFVAISAILAILVSNTKSFMCGMAIGFLVHSTMLVISDTLGLIRSDEYIRIIENDK